MRPPVPAALALVSVVAACGGTSVDGEPLAPPLPAHEPTCAGGDAFAPPLCFPRAERAYVDAATVALSAADTDGDGTDELVLAQAEARRLLRMRRGEGGLQPWAVDAGGGPVALDVADLDGDGLADVVLGTVGDGTPSVAIGYGADGLRVARFAELATEPFAVAGAVGPRGPLVAVAREGSPEVTVHAPVGASGAAVVRSVDLRAQPVGVTALSVGYFAVALRVDGAGAVAVIAMEGDSLREVARARVPGEPNGIAAGSLGASAAGVGSEIVVTLDGENGALVVLRWEGDTLEPAAPLVVGPFPHAVALGDVDADGRLDAVVVLGAAAHVEIFRGDGRGRLRTSAPLAHGIAAATSLALGDLDGDGFLDVAVGGIDGELAVLTSSLGETVRR